MESTDEQSAQEVAALIIDILQHDVKPERRSEAHKKLLNLVQQGFDEYKRMQNEEFLKYLSAQ